MFELSVATKYLIPKWRQLSVSLISLISCAVIALVVWLILVFFSVTNGLERMWIDKLITLTAPVRVTPTDAYYKSWYYQIDSISSGSDFNVKNISEKLASLEVDPYDRNVDQEIPRDWLRPHLGADGQPRDLVKELFEVIEQQRVITPLSASPFEVAQAQLKLNMTRPVRTNESPLPNGQSELRDFVFNKSATIVSLDEENVSLHKTLLPISPEDLTNVWHNISQKKGHWQKPFQESTEITKWRAPKQGWVIPAHMHPKNGAVEGISLLNGVTILPKDQKHKKQFLAEAATYNIPHEVKEVSFPTQEKLLLPHEVEITLNGNALHFAIQKTPFEAEMEPYGLIATEGKVLNVNQTPFWLRQEEVEGVKHYTLPFDPSLGDGVLLPKGFYDQGARIGDSGYLVYESPSLTQMGAMQQPIYVAGFYDQGIMSLGGKFVMVAPEVASVIRSQSGADLVPQSNGVHVRFADYSYAPLVKEAIEKDLKSRGLSQYFAVESFREYDFISPFLQELSSQKNLFTILAGIIIIVACSNIISMLIILVNDKKKEIGILRSMGASTASVALIFGCAGLMMGLTGSLVGIFAAIVTLDFLPEIVGLLSSIQGFAAFNSAFYGDTLPHELSFDALRFVIIFTSVTSLISGLVPAIKACLVKPAQTLRSE